MMPDEVVRTMMLWNGSQKTREKNMTRFSQCIRQAIKKKIQAWPDKRSASTPGRDGAKAQKVPPTSSKLCQKDVPSISLCDPNQATAPRELHPTTNPNWRDGSRLFIHFSILSTEQSKRGLMTPAYDLRQRGGGGWN